MKTSKISGSLAAVLFAVIALASPRPSSAQPMDLDTPVGSPLWWTLTDEITPAQLRSTFRDPQAQIDRYRAAMNAGVAAQNLTEEQLGYIRFYYNTRINPELTPMWLAFDSFANGHLDFQGTGHATNALTEFGFGKTAINTILGFATRQTESARKIADEIRSKSKEFVEIQRRAIKDLGGDRPAIAAVEKAARGGSLEVLQSDTGKSQRELAELRAAWRRIPATEAAEALLPQLRQQLTEEDWQRFRRFLLKHVVANMGDQVMDTDPAQGVTP